MQSTVKIITENGNERVIPTTGEINIYRDGGVGFSEMLADAEKHGVNTQDCRAIISYQCEDYGSFVYLYDEDRAYVMNESGKTVATV